MTQTTSGRVSPRHDPTTEIKSTSFPLPDVLSSELMQLIDRVKPSIVQVRNGGRGAGTGIIWRTDGKDSTDGTIVTNHHVVPNDEWTIQVHLADNRVFDAKVIDRNPKLDIALLKMTAENLAAVPVGDSSRLRVGELVFAIGHPWGQRWVATAGIVSGLGTLKISEEDEEDKDKVTPYIKSDVSIAPGYSGGPLLDAQGTVVGINAMVLGGDLAVSIPSNVVSSWIEGLRKRQVTLNIEVQPVELPANFRQGTLAKRETGLLVIATSIDGVADTADVLVGDVLLDIDSQPLDDVSSLLDILVRSDAKSTIRLNVIRGGVTQVIDVVEAALVAAEGNEHST